MYKVTIQGAGKLPLNITSFESSADFADHCLTSGAAETAYLSLTSSNKRDSFYGDHVEDARKFAVTGDNDRAEKSDKILAKIESFLSYETTKFMRSYDVAGGVPCVPRFLSGHPAAMMSRRRVESDQGPITIVFDATVSAGVENKAIERRGAATLAVLRALSISRPVQLLIGTGIKVGYGQGKKDQQIAVIKIDSSPLDLARAAWFLQSPSLLRRFGFAFSANAAGHAGDGAMLWLNGDSTKHAAAIQDSIKAVSGTDVFLTIPGFHLRDDQSIFDTDDSALSWVQSALVKAAAM
jgi:hypothetical protein